MGADFILYHCEYPGDWKKAEPIVNRRIEKISNHVLDHIGESYFWGDIEDIKEETGEGLKEEDLWKLDNLYDIKIRAFVKGKVKEAVDEIMDEKWYRRDVAEVQLNGVLYLFTGGMSWGDMPTEACDTIGIICDSGVFDGLGNINFDYEGYNE